MTQAQRSSRPLPTRARCRNDDWRREPVPAAASLLALLDGWRVLTASYRLAGAPGLPRHFEYLRTFGEWRRRGDLGRAWRTPRRASNASTPTSASDGQHASEGGGGRVTALLPAEDGGDDGQDVSRTPLPRRRPTAPVCAGAAADARVVDRSSSSSRRRCRRAVRKLPAREPRRARARDGARTPSPFGPWREGYGAVQPVRRSRRRNTRSSRRRQVLRRSRACFGSACQQPDDVVERNARGSSSARGSASSSPEPRTSRRYPHDRSAIIKNSWWDEPSWTR